MRYSVLIVIMFILVGRPLMAQKGEIPSSPTNQAPNKSQTQKPVWELGIEMSSIAYKEPGVMSQKGTMFGLAGSYCDSAQKLRIEGRFSQGEVDYDGALADDTPIKISNIPDYLLELRVLAGIHSWEAKTHPTLYVGFGYRYLNDNASLVSPYGYERESNYMYLPLALEMTHSVTISNQPRTLWTTLEYDYLLNGKQVSHLSDVDPGYSDITNGQDSGSGWRASAKLDLEKASIEVFTRFWNIKESYSSIIYYDGVPDDLGIEPDNRSKEIGLKITTRF